MATLLFDDEVAFSACDTLLLLQGSGGGGWLGLSWCYTSLVDIVFLIPFSSNISSRDLGASCMGF